MLFEEYLFCSFKLLILLCFFCGMGVFDFFIFDEDFRSDGGLSSIVFVDVNGGLLGFFNL